MNKLLEHAVRSEYEMNPQNDETSEALCYSEYDVFRRGEGNYFVNSLTNKHRCGEKITPYSFSN